MINKLLYEFWFAGRQQGVNPRELTTVSDRGERTQLPTCKLKDDE